eukprot:Nitzschia sp. Nitz4//scaffold41_size133979//23900//24334//NITZ4_003332-RA/size133979-processed-gene-0.239-mRNA-1//-1//CDS//3329551425//6622//frame0
MSQGTDSHDNIDDSTGFYGASIDPKSTTDTDMTGGNNLIAEADVSAESDFNGIVHDTVALLEKKLQCNHEWAKRIIDDMSLFAKALKESHLEYTKILKIEQDESERLDRIEPEVHGATSRLLEQSFLRNGEGGLTGLKRKQLDA